MDKANRTSDDRPAFERWLLTTHGLESEWEEARNCYKEFAAHLAWCAWEAAINTRSRLPPWKAFIGLVACGVGAALAYHLKDYSATYLMSGLIGMFLQDWIYRLRDKHDPARRIGNE